MKRSIVGSCALAVLTALPCSAQSLGDLLKHIGDAVRDTAEERVKDAVDGGCRSQESRAETSSPDYSVRPSWVVRTTDGRTFQIRALAVMGDSSSDMPLPYLIGLASNISFSLLDSAAGGFVNRYRLELSYSQAQSEDGTIAGAVVAGAMNAVVDKRAPRQVTANIASITGQSLDGSEWCLALRQSQISSAEQIR